MKKSGGRGTVDTERTLVISKKKYGKGRKWTIDGNRWQQKANDVEADRRR